MMNSVTSTTPYQSLERAQETHSASWNRYKMLSAVSAIVSAATAVVFFGLFALEAKTAANKDREIAELSCGMIASCAAGAFGAASVLFGMRD